MKRIFAILLLLTAFYADSQNFGDFASAIYLNNCNTTQFYNTSGSGANCINPTCGTVFHGTNFGSFNQNSGGFTLKGGEIKTWKNACCGNVCGGKLNYAVYTTGARPGSPVFSNINLPFKCNCGGATFTDGLGPCGGSDQKWSVETTGPIDFTNRAPGNYTVEIYYEYYGDDGSNSGCGTTKYINNGGNPTNYTATFQVVASSASCGLLPIDLYSFRAECNDDVKTISWVTKSEKNSSHFYVESSQDANKWDTIQRLDAAGNSSKERHYSVVDSVRSTQLNYYRLTEYDLDGKLTLDNIIQITCTSIENLFYSYPNPSQNEINIYYQNNSHKGIYELSIFDLNNKLVYSDKLDIKKGVNLFLIKQELSKGLYFICISNSENEKEILKHVIY